MNEDLVYGIVAFGKFDKEVCLLSKEDDKIFGKLKVYLVISNKINRCM